MFARRPAARRKPLKEAIGQQRVRLGRRKVTDAGRHGARGKPLRPIRRALPAREIVKKYRPHPEELAKQASRRMAATCGLAAILRDAHNCAHRGGNDATVRRAPARRAGWSRRRNPPSWGFKTADHDPPYARYASVWLSVPSDEPTPSAPKTGSRSLPLIPHHALAGVAAGDIRELAFEGGRRRPAVEPFLFYRRCDKRGIGSLRRAVDDEGCTRQRLEGGGDRSVGIKIMRPGRAAAQRENAIGHRPGFVGANTRLAAGIGDVPGAIAQRKCV